MAEINKWPMQTDMTLLIVFSLVTVVFSCVTLREVSDDGMNDKALVLIVLKLLCLFLFFGCGRYILLFWEPYCHGVI